ncbi:NACHT domain-containing protein [Paractinoplanes globisporus]|uniref:NACHT domain-containing protein n=1 Tax=Paractinoplanes globisporus TaxID=113565 RepID=A0ABW6WWU2_9ACTN|nr:NACHT domain-containing protein [Actinoplanes globisporus]
MADKGLASLVPYGFGGLLLLAIVLWALKQFLGRVLQEMGTRFSGLFVRQISASRILNARALRAYRLAVRANFARHRLGFVNEQVDDGSNVDILKVYVPLQYETSGERRDVYDWLRRQRRVIVLGPPGAGKSMLLKHSMLIWAMDTGVSAMRLPVMVDLHRCNGNDASIARLIEAELIRNDVRKGPAFVESALRDGELAVLLDGLDEVGKDDQDRVARMIADFAREYARCQIVVTCRTAAYFGQLEPEFTDRVKVADFDDANIRRFLANWPGMSATDGEKLFFDLQHNQQLMRLAASPLLLTMIAYLYTEVLTKSGRTLPSSRAAFYELAVDHLLRRDLHLLRHKTLSVYDWQDKLAVLQKVALALQEAPADRPDRRSIDKDDLIAVTNAMLPDLNLGPEHGRLLIEEIDQRSQLLVKLDRRSSRYAFPHLTLQEYLAAVELAARPEALLDRYFADPTGWRETVKLWCGASSRECTQVVQEIFTKGDYRDSVLALECVAEAKRIDNELALSVIDYFLSRLGSPHLDQAAVINALSAVASDSRPRGQFVFNQLVRSASMFLPERRVAIAALAKTRLPQAVEVLAERAATGDEDARTSLRSMGEQAIPALCTQIGRAHVDPLSSYVDMALQLNRRALQAVDDLAIIGTPAAAEALAELIWSDDAIAVRAAWRLAELLRQGDIEAHLRLNSLVGRGETLDWVSAPFRGPDSGSLPSVIGRIALHLDRNGAGGMPDDISYVDARLAIPLGLVEAVRERHVHLEVPPPQMTFMIWQMSNVTSSSWSDVERVVETLPEPPAREICDTVLAAHGVGEFRRRLVAMLDDPIYRAATGRVFCRSDPAASHQHWSTVNTNPKQPHLLLALSLLLLAPLAVGVVGVGLVRLLGSVFDYWPWGPRWFGLTVVAVILLGILVTGLLTIPEALGLRSAATDRLNKALLDADAFALFIGVWFLVSVAGVSVLGVVSLAEWFGWLSALAGLAVLSAVDVVFFMAWRRRVAAVANPLRPIRDLAALNLGSRMSIIGSEPAAAAKG